MRFAKYLKGLISAGTPQPFLTSYYSTGTPGLLNLRPIPRIDTTTLSLWVRDNDGVKGGHGTIHPHLFRFLTLISRSACHYHLRLKFPNTAPPTGDTGQKLWVLLTRHVTNTKESSGYIALRVENEIDRRISQQRIDQIAEAVSGMSLIPAWANLSGVNYTLSGLIHKFDTCVGKLYRI